MPECDYHGFELSAWIREGLVDYVVPSDFNHINFNTVTMGHFLKSFCRNLSLFSQMSHKIQKEITMFS